MNAEANPMASMYEDDEELDLLDLFGEALADTRKEAVDGRQTSGIEDVWTEDELFYEGIDSANQHEHKLTYRQKPWGRAPSDRGRDTTKSSVFPNITRPYCDMAAARISDMLMPTDDRAFAIEPTPVPDLITLNDGKLPKAMAQQLDAEMAAGMPQEEADAIQADAQDQAKQIMEQANDQADLAQERIDDWLTEANFQAENRRVIEDATRIGTGILKGPIPEVKKVTVFKDGQLLIKEEVKPVSRRIDPWNFFPDPACGENIHNGAYTWERDYMTRKRLRELKGQDGYLDEQIEKCLHEGPTDPKDQKMPNSEMTQTKNQFEIWFYHGVAEREQLEAAGMEFEDEDGEGSEPYLPYLPCMVVMVNRHVIKAVLNPLDTGDFPYDVMVWQRRNGFWAGIGVGRHIRTPQRIVVGATRHLMDNAGTAAGPMMVFLQGVASPGDNVLGAAPRKVFIASEDSNIQDASRAVATIKVDMLVNELLEIVNFGLRLAEDVTGMPMLLQGQMGQKAPDTLGGMEMLFNSASSVLRRLARLYDDLITESHIGRYYTWLLQYGDDDEEKGDCTVQARGSSALVERSIQSQELAQILQMAQSPLYGIDPIKAAEEYLKSRHFDPEMFKFDDDKWQEIVQNLQQPQENDPRLEIATINAQLKEITEQMKYDDKERDRQFEAEQTEREQLFEAQQNQIAQEYDLAMGEYEAMLKRELAAMDAENKQVISFDRIRQNADKIKADLAETVLEIRAQKDMADIKTQMPQVADTPAEPPKRAAAGMAYQQ